MKTNELTEYLRRWRTISIGFRMTMWFRTMMVDRRRIFSLKIIEK